MDIINMPDVIFFVTERMLPKTTLPNSSLMTFKTDIGTVFGNPLENIFLIARQRPEKSSSPSGRVKMLGNCSLRCSLSRPPLFNPQHHLLSRCDSGILSVDSLPERETNSLFKRLALLCYRGKLRTQPRRKRPAYVQTPRSLGF